jgi:hypothetical protein
MKTRPRLPTTGLLSGFVCSGHSRLHEPETTSTNEEQQMPLCMDLHSHVGRVAA